MQSGSAPRKATARPGEPVRVMLVDDSSVIRGLMARWIEADPEIEVAASVSNGAQAVKEIAASGVDVVILDIEMPVMDGITALPEILKAAPHVKVVMSSTLTRRNADISIKALKLGAADYLPKPESVRGVTTSDDFRRDLLDKVKALGVAARRSRPASLLRARANAPAAMPADLRGRIAGHETNVTLRAPSNVAPRILAIGSSTGGPQALFHFFGIAGPKLSVPVVITQHMPATFTAILAEHLAKASGRPAKEAEDGDKLEAGKIYVAPGGRHMLLRKAGDSVHVKLDDGPQENFCRPAVDPMLRTVAEIYGSAALTVILTGMGHDGREGAKRIVAAGGTVLAQDAGTSVVWGMPGAVAEAGLCAAVLPLSMVAEKTVQLLKGAR